MSDSSSPQTPFLGGGPRFNQAGNNTPLPGEKKEDAPDPPLFGGPRVWIGTAVVLMLLLTLFIFYGQSIIGPQHPLHPSVSPSDKPDINPDSP